MIYQVENKKNSSTLYPILFPKVALGFTQIPKPNEHRLLLRLANRFHPPACKRFNVFQCASITSLGWPFLDYSTDQNK